MFQLRFQLNARVVKLADTPDLGSGAVRREGSSPSPSTKNTVAFTQLTSLDLDQKRQLTPIWLANNSKPSGIRLNGFNQGSLRV